MSEADATLIEGIGDEVLLFASVSLSLVVAALVAYYVPSSIRPWSGSRTQRTRQEASAASSERNRATGDTAVEGSSRASHTYTQLPRDDAGNAAETAANSTLLDANENPQQQQVQEDSTETVLEGMDPDVVRRRRLEFMERNSHVESLSNATEGAQPSCEALQQTDDSVSDEAAAEDDEEQEEGFAIRLKYLNDTERCVRGRPDETVGSFKRRHFAAELAGQRLVRLIFNGGQLRDDSARLSSCGFSEGCVVHVHVSTAPVVPNDASSSSSSGEGDLNLGALMWPLFAATLGILWVLHFQYRELFNTPSTVVLVGISGLFCVGLYGQHYPQSPAAQQVAAGRAEDVRTTPLPRR
uniref:Putative transmembrane and ubiquitin-like domain-containing protein 2 n=1 Tax=Amblyomma aureolatum TaxID=187763 RepID=A0A1E1XDJ5_9ACAR